MALNWLITLHILLLWHHMTIFCSPTWNNTWLGTWQAVSDRWWGHICSWRLFRGSGWELLYQGNQHCNTDGRSVWTEGETMLKSKRHNSRYRKYAIWPRDGACHANHACAALTVSRSCRQAFVFFHWKCTQELQKILEFEYETDMFSKIPSWFIETFGCIFKIWVGYMYVIRSKN